MASVVISPCLASIIDFATLSASCWPICLTFSSKTEDKNSEYTDFGKRPGCLYPVNTAPFHASTGGIWLLIVTGGLRTNANLQVLDTNDQVIPGLYAVGTLVGDMYEGIYTFVLPGHNLGATCDTFGYVAGQYIAANEPGS